MVPSQMSSLYTVFLLLLFGSLSAARAGGRQPDSLYDEAERFELEKRWLASLEMSSVPVVRRSQPVPEYMRTIFNHLDFADNDASGELSAKLKAPEPKKQLQSVVGISPTEVDATDTRLLMTFDVSDDVRFKDASRVELVLARRSSVTAASYHFLRPRVALCVDALHCTPLERVQNRPLNSSTLTFDAFDITDAYLRWQKKQTRDAERFHVFLQLTSGPNELYDMNGEIQLVLYHNFPRDLLWPSTPSPPLVQRSRRSTSSHSELCHLEPWTFSFTRMGWDAWVITPTGFEANYCVGPCPEPLLNSSITFTNYAGIKSLFRSRGFADSLEPPAASCVPLHMTAVSLLVQKSESVVEVKHLDEMKALDCACL